MVVASSALPLVGRRSEIGFLWNRYLDAADGSGSVVLVVGDAGIGKTRLTKEFFTRAEAAGGVSVTSACSEITPGPLAPILAAFRKLAPQRASVIDGEASSNARVQFALLARAFEETCRERPVVIALENVHWSDVATIEFVQFFAVRAAKLRIVLVLTYRPGEIAWDSLLEGAVLRLLSSPTTWKLSLGPLTDVEVAELVRLGKGVETTVSASVIARINAISEGNPLLAEELMAQLRGVDDVNAASDLPNSVKEGVLRRFSLLNEKERDLLRMAAVVGRSFDENFLAHLAVTSVSEILDALHNAQRAGLLVDDADRRGSHRFRHALTREAIYEEIPEDLRRATHERVITALENAREPEPLEQFAYHAWAAADSARAISYNVDCGDEAALMSAHRDAARYYERALPFLATSTAEWAAVCEKLAQNLKVVGLPKKAKQAFLQIAEYAWSCQHVERAADFYLDVGQQAYDAGDDDSLDWRIRGLDAIQSNVEHPLFCEALVDVAKAYSLRGDVRTASEYFERALVCLKSATITTRVDFLQYRGLNFALKGDARRAIDDCRNAISIIDEETRATSASIAYTQLAIVASLFGDITTAREGCERSIALARRKDMPLFEASGLVLLAKVNLLANDLAAARVALLSGLRVATEFERGWIYFLATEVTILLGLALDDPDLIAAYVQEDEIERAFRSGESAQIAPVAAAFAELFRARGRTHDASRLLRRALGAVSNCGKAPWMPLAVARYGYEADISAARRLLRDWASPVQNPAASAYLALFEAYASRDDSQKTQSAAANARREFSELGLMYFADHASVLAGDARITGTTQPSNPLTRRENEIAELVGTGKANRTIAESLHVSVRTVETHLTSIFSKLGFESRAELAAYIARGGSR